MQINTKEIHKVKNTLFNDSSYGHILRLKGFVKNKDKWIRINITKNEEEISDILKGENVLIIIGENLNKEKIESLFN